MNPKSMIMRVLFALVALRVAHAEPERTGALTLHGPADIMVHSIGRMSPSPLFAAWVKMSASQAGARLFEYRMRDTTYYSMYFNSANQLSVRVVDSQPFLVPGTFTQTLTDGLWRLLSARMITPTGAFGAGSGTQVELGLDGQVLVVCGMSDEDVARNFANSPPETFLLGGFSGSVAAAYSYSNAFGSRGAVSAADLDSMFVQQKARPFNLGLTQFAFFFSRTFQTPVYTRQLLSSSEWSSPLYAESGSQPRFESVICTPLPCLNGGSCVVGDTSNTCDCPFPTSGSQCQQVATVLACTHPQNCLNGATCTAETSPATPNCVCAPFFWGEFCQNRVENPDSDVIQAGSSATGVVFNSARASFSPMWTLCSLFSVWAIFL